ncbi:glycosyltransferase [Asticcacaulis sp. W401b]|uniref:glycosyltransferase n=1 Tax=Asticcacaulis sp. W401b TaxID=3388666 RepID=UPI003971070E
MPRPGRNTYRDELGIDATQFVVLYAGNIGKKQALHLVADAAEALQENAGIVFVIAGEGPEKSKLVERNLPNIRFLPLQPEERLGDLLALADAHVLPQESDVADLVLPSKLGGMLASGRAMIVMANEDTELFDFLEGEARIVPPGDASALAQAILAEIETPSPKHTGRRERLLRALSRPDAMSVFTDSLLSQGRPAEDQLLLKPTQ